MDVQNLLAAYIASANPNLYRQKMAEQELARQQLEARRLAESMTSKLFGQSPTGPAQQQMRSQQSPADTFTNIKQSMNAGPFDKIIMEASQQYGVPPDVIKRIIEVESSGNPDAVSPTGAQGLMQLFPAAATDAGVDPNNLLDPTNNIMGGTSYIKQMLDRFGPKQAFQAYNQGPTSVASGKSTPEGLSYQSKFEDILPLLAQNGQQMPDANIVQPQGSKFLPNPMQGGSGILGNDMDPMRRSFIEMLRDAFATGNPQMLQFALENLSKMQGSTMSDIARTPLQKNMASTNLQPGSEEYSRAILDNVRRGGLNINIGDNKPLSLEQSTSLVDSNTGERVQVPVGADMSWIRDYEAQHGSRLNYAKPPTSEEATKSAQSESAIQMANELDTLIKNGANIDSFWGKIQQMRAGEDVPNIVATAIMDVMGVGDNPNDTRAYAISESLSNTVLQAFRGVAVGVQEQERFNHQLPRPGMPKELIKQNIALTIKNLKYLNERREAIRRGTTPPPYPSWIKNPPNTPAIKDAAPEGFTWE